MKIIVLLCIFLFACSSAPTTFENGNKDKVITDNSDYSLPDTDNQVDNCFIQEYKNGKDLSAFVVCAPANIPSWENIPDPPMDKGDPYREKILNNKIENLSEEVLIRTEFIQ